MSLLRRLVLVTVAVVAAALVAADAGAYLALRSFLVAQAEQDLVTAANQSLKLVFDPLGIGRGAVDALKSPISGAAIAVYDPAGQLIGQAPTAGSDKVALPLPVLPDPAQIPRLIPAGGGEFPFAALNGTVSAPAVSGAFDYMVVGITAKDQSVVVVAFPLNEMSATLRQLAIIEIVITVAVLGLVALTATHIVAIALRPLAGIEDTATRIAAGDLGRRITTVDKRTEIGRLGHALNAMLSRIEAALSAREASEQRLRRLVTDASHELRTPLTSIRGYAELFRLGADARPADLARAMRGIELESERMGSLVDELLLLARLDEGQPLTAGEEDLVPVVQAAVDAARAIEPDRPIEVLLPGTAFVRADSGRMRQVVDNLLANVRVHTPRGTPAAVTVRSVAGRVIIEVADAGPGLSETARSRVFERFYRADPSRSRDSGGSGLGLAIVAAIARAYGGEVRVESEPGNGARFMVDWPAAVGPAVALDPHSR